MMRVPTILRKAALVFSLSFGAAHAQDFVSPDILILGDSQITFGSGPVFQEFFSNIERHCSPTPQQAASLARLDQQRVATIGIRSTSLPSWIARRGSNKGAICDIDPTWGVNGGSYGFLNQTGNKYIQVGRGSAYQYCASGQSAFEHMFRDDYYRPSLLLMTFLGNSARRWADDPQAAIRDVREMTAQLPDGQPCIFMTTAPAYRQDIVDRRHQAQTNLEAAFVATGSHCSFVQGSTPETIAANVGNRRHFRQRDNGSVKDPFHPNRRASERFFEIEGDAICNAIFEQLDVLAPQQVAADLPWYIGHEQ